MKTEKQTLLTCSVDGCLSPPRSKFAKFCEMHYGRLRRNGHTGLRNPPEVRETSHGYVKVKSPLHPLTTPADRLRVYEHRAEFHSQFGEGPFLCAGCGIELSWREANVCRHNEDRLDNRIGNLEIRCRSCASKISYLASKPSLEQAHYRWIDWQGKRQTVTDWAKELGMKPGTMLRRLNAGWSVERIMTVPVNGARSSPKLARRKLSDAQKSEILAMVGHFSYPEIAALYGVGTSTIGRIARGER